MPPKSLDCGGTERLRYLGHPLMTFRGTVGPYLRKACGLPSTEVPGTFPRPIPHNQHHNGNFRSYIHLETVNLTSTYTYSQHVTRGHLRHTPRSKSRPRLQAMFGCICLLFPVLIDRP